MEGFDQMEQKKKRNNMKGKAKKPPPDVQLLAQIPVQRKNLLS